jgi:hypothetical protein
LFIIECDPPPADLIIRLLLLLLSVHAIFTHCR